MASTFWVLVVPGHHDGDHDGGDGGDNGDLDGIGDTLVETGSQFKLKNSFTNLF